MPHQIAHCRFRRVLLWGACTAVVVAAVAPAAQRSATPADLVTRRVRVRDVGPDPNVAPTPAAPPDVNIRDKPSEVVPPPAKASAGRALCAVTFDNHTDLITKTYIDSRYSGTIRPFGELSASIVPGSAVLYARAEYNDGSADAWGPVRVSCRTKYVWRLAD